MSKSGNTTLRLGIAASSLTLALAVYVFAREYPPAIIESLQIPAPWLLEHGRLFGSAPSLFYTLAFGLLLGVISAEPRRGQLHCLVWTAIALLLELTQAPEVAGTFIAAFDRLPPVAADLLTPYWKNGTFDPVDLLATLLGGASAWGVLRILPGRSEDVQAH